MAPCGWTVTTCGGCGKCWEKYDPAVRTRAEDVSAMIMWAATGRRFGACEITVQPAGRCAPGEPLYQTYEVGPSGYGIASPVIDRGTWYNRPGGGCCSTGCEIWLDGPTTKAQVAAVTVAGELVDADAYVVMDGHLLVRTDGGCWPCCVNYGEQSPAGFTVRYTVGVPIPPAVQAAFERLACDVAKACAGGACALPQRLTRLSRQGVDIEVEQIPVDAPTGLILTGLKEVDDVIRAVNPHALTAPPMVLSPDLPPPARRLT